MTSDHDASMRLKKVAFVTVGATAPFEELIKAVLEPEFLQALQEKEYTALVCQTGTSINIFDELKPKDGEFGMKYTGFQFNKKGLGDEMRQVKAKEDDSREGVVITAAGAGTILDGLRIGVPLIVVANEKLLDNHQVELAEELEKQGYVTHSTISVLAKALEKSEQLVSKTWGGESRSINPVMDEMVGREEMVKGSLD